MVSEASVMRPTRRRVLAIMAATAASAALPQLARASKFKTFTWRGVALGAEATLTVQHDDAAAAHAAIAAALDEVARLETIFSLHRQDSALARLNAAGRLDDAPGDLIVLVAEALRLSKLTDGAFDPTVQPLWALYARHFSDPRTDPRGPDTAAVAQALRHVGWQHVGVDGRTICLKPGMALTLNGIAQGYITDKVGDILKARGFTHVLVNMGEQLAVGPKQQGEAWTIGIASPDGSGAQLTSVPLASGAMAASGGYGCAFDADGTFTHILDPRTGASARQWASISVVAERATLADGLSTALTVLPAAEANRLLGSHARAYAVLRNSTTGVWLPHA